MNRNTITRKRKTRRKLAAGEKARKIALRRDLRQKAKELAPRGE
jgi:hypothetical protein